MMLSEEVAAALGRVPCTAWRLFFPGFGGGDWIKDSPCDHTDCYPVSQPPDYEHNWALTGPLIERFGISLAPVGDVHRAYLDVRNGYGVTCDRLLAAVCRVVVWACKNQVENPLTSPTPRA